MGKSRYFETAELMDSAFLDLLQEKPLEFITIKEICVRACVSRSTFYLHYESIVDLLEESVRLVLDRFFNAFGDEATENIQSSILENRKDGLMLVTPSYLKPYLEFIRDNRKLFSALIENSKAMQLEAIYSRMEQSTIEPILDRFGIAENDRHYYMSFYLSGCMAIIEEWVKTGCTDPIERIMSILECCCHQKGDIPSSNS